MRVKKGEKCGGEETEGEDVGSLAGFGSEALAVSLRKGEGRRCVGSMGWDIALLGGRPCLHDQSMLRTLVGPGLSIVLAMINHSVTGSNFTRSEMTFLHNCPRS